MLDCIIELCKREDEKEGDVLVGICWNQMFIIIESRLIIKVKILSY